MKKLVSLVLALLLIATSMLGAVATAEELPTLRVAVIPVVGSLTIPYIMDHGWDKENGFQIEPVVFSTGAPMGEALAANLWDVGLMSIAGVFAVANYDALLIGEANDSIGENGIGVYVRPDSDIAQIQGSNPTYPELYGDADSVRGKTILCALGTISHYQVVKWLEKIGLKDTDVSIVHMEFAQAYQAFMSGQGDIVALNSPTCFKAANEGMVNVAFIGEGGLEISLSDWAFANKQTYDEKYDMIKKCIELIYRANEELDADPEGKKEALANWYKANGSEIADEVIAREAAKNFYTLDEMREMPPLGASFIEGAEFFASINTLETEKLPIIEANVNPDILNELLAQ